MKKSVELEKFIWDTTQNPSDYPQFLKKIYFKLFLKNRRKFSIWISKYSKKNTEKIFTLVKLPYSRDPFKSNLLKNIIILIILKDYKVSQKIKKIVFENKSVRDSYLNFNGKKKIEIDIKKDNFSNFTIFKNFIFSFLVFFFIKSLKIKKKIYSEKITLFDTSISCEEKVKDFVFPDLNQILQKKKIKNYFFVPNILLTRKVFSLYRNLKSLSKKNYLFKENYINFYEFLNCFILTLLKKPEKIKKNLKFQNIDLSKIIEEEMKKKTHFFSEFHSNLKIIFIKKIHKLRFRLKKSIGRFENQSLDKAWFYGMNKYYPNVETIGFQNFLYYPHLLNQSPTFYENESKLIPKKIVVTSKIAKFRRKEFFRSVKVLLGPSLGKQNVFKKFKLSKKYKFVLALCGIKLIDEKMLLWISYTLKNDQDFRLIIKPHPSMSITKLTNYKKYDFINNDRCKVTSEDIHNLLKKTEILISSGPTGVSFESIIYSCKLLYLVLDPSDLLMFKKIPKNNYVLAKDEIELFKQINIWKNKKIIKKNNNLKSLFFTKINDNNLKIFY